MRRPLAVLALVALVPPAMADHVFSHRVYVTGRVVDADGRPVPDASVSVAFANVAIAGACLNGGNDRTSETGDFSVCRHAHVIPPGTTVNVTVEGASADAPIDPALRSAELLLQTPARRTHPTIQGDATFNATFRVAGRSFQLLAAPEDAENVEVNATPRASVNVTVSLGNASKEVKLDEWGSYSADLAVGTIPPGARATATAGGSSWSVEASPLFRRANVDVVKAAPEVVGADRPGASVPAAGLALTLGALALTGAASRRR